MQQPSSEILSQDWNFDLLKRSFATQDGGGGSPNASEESSKETSVGLCFILANHNGNDG